MTYKKSNAGLQLESANFGSGVIRANNSASGGFEVNYFLTDHLGSVRVIVDANGTVKERNDYYPFGARHARADYAQQDGNRHKYNGKEEQTTGNLDYLDYGARMYDAALGRWFTMDPKAEDYYFTTPYCHVFNNPLLWVDPNGENPAIVVVVGGVSVVLSTIDLLLIGTGLVTSGIILKQKLDGSGVELTESAMDLWTGVIDLFATIFMSEYSKEHEWQKKQDRKNKEEIDQNQADIANSINTNYEGPSPDGNKWPNRELNKLEKFGVISLLLTYLQHSCDDPVRQTEIHKTTLDVLLDFFDIKKEKNKDKK